jgi:hypothetical protein
VLVLVAAVDVLVAEVVVLDVELVVFVATLVVAAFVVEETVPLPKFMDTLYAVTVKTALDPVNGSVPAPMLVTYWLVLKPLLPTRYVKNSFRSELKLVTWFCATKENTFIEPLRP